MNKITFPLKPQTQGPAVGDLQAALQFLLDNGLLLKEDADSRQELSAKLKEGKAAQRYGETTWKLVRRFQEEQHLEVTGNVDEVTANAINRLCAPSGSDGTKGEGGKGDEGKGDGDGKKGGEGYKGEDGGKTKYSVEGTVRYSDGLPAAGITVAAFDRDFRSEEVLGQCDTDSEGTYRIEYTRDQFLRIEKRSADLVMKVLGSDGSVILATGTLFNAPLEAAVDLVLPANNAVLPSEYERIMAELEPLFNNIVIPVVPAASASSASSTIDTLADLKPEDIDFLTGETEIERQRIEFLSRGALLEKQGEAQDLELPAAAFYGLAREGLPLDISALYSYTPKAQRDALTQALSDNIIPAAIKDKLDKIVADLQKLIGQNALKTPTVEGGNSLSDLLGLSLPSPEKQAELVALYTGHQGPVEEFWAKLRAQPDFNKPGVVEGIQRNLQLGMLTQNHVPLIQELERRHQPKSLRDLAKLDKDDWSALINTKLDGKPIGVPPGVLGNTLEEKAASYISGMTGLLQAVFSTDAIAGILAKSPDLKLEPPLRKNVNRFFSNSPEFDFRTVRINDYLADPKNAEKAFNGIEEKDRPGVISYAKRLGRLLPTSTGPESMKALMNSRFGSATAIATTPRATFIAEMKNDLGGANQAAAVYERAQRVHAAALHVYTQVYQATNDVQPFVLNASAAAVKAAVLKQSPTWTELFGSLDLCDCTDCRSVLSPAAYFVDILHLLDNSIRNEALESPLEVLLQRRPDLEYIKLTCENTNRPIPYVDLVNEVLESYLVYGQTLPVIKTTPPPPQMPMIINNPNDSSDDITAEELAANPENTNAAAYDILRKAVYPLGLPYNYPVEAARVYLDHLGSSRREVMKTFQKTGIPTDLDIACEYLGISPELRDILTDVPIKVPPDNLRDYDLRDFYGYDQDEYQADKRPSLARGRQGADVVALQHLLNSAGAKPLLPLNGIFDAATETAVKALNDSRSLGGGVTADTNTWKYLDSVEEVWLAYLAQIPEFLTHTGISYPDTIELFKTRFINPDQQSLTFFQSLKIPYQDWVDWHDKGYKDPGNALVRAVTSAYPDLTLDQALATLRGWTEQNFEKLNKTIVLYAPVGSECDLALTGIQLAGGGDIYVNPPILIPVVPAAATQDVNPWDKIHRFIRLSRKLGWALADLDKALTALGAADITTGLLQKLTQTRQLQTELGAPLLQILSLWADIDTWGENSLYRKLFLNKAVLAIDPVFQPNPDGTVLTAPGLTISDHIPALLAALRLRATDLAAIRAEVGLDAETVPLNLPNLSLLYRYAFLAKALTLRVPDFIAIKRLSGMNPFDTPDDTLKFKAMADAVQQQSDFPVPVLNYLYRHLTAPPPDFAPQTTVLLLLAKTLRNGLTQITKDNTIAPDPNGDLTRTRLSLIFDSATVDSIIGMINGNAIYSAPLTALPDAIAKKDPANNKVVGIDPLKLPAEVAKKLSWDPATRTLRFRGAMTTKEENTVLGLSADGTYQGAVKSLYGQPATLIKNTLKGFLNLADAEKPLLRDLPSLDPNLHPVLLDKDGNIISTDGSGNPIDANGNPLDPAKIDTTAIAKKFAYLLEWLLPYLREQLSHALVKQAIVDAFGLESEVAQRLLEKVLKSPRPAVDPKHPDPIISDLLALQTPGLTAGYFAAADLTGPFTAGTNSSIAFDGTAVKLPLGTRSVRWAGLLLAPSSGDFTFIVNTTGNVQLWVGDEDNFLELALDPDTHEQVSKPVTLKGGGLYSLRLELKNLPADKGIAELYWQAATLPKTIIPADNLYPRELFDNLVAAYTRLQKAALIVNGFQLADQEIAYFSDHSTDFENFDLNALPLARDNNTTPNVDKNAPALFKAWLRIAAYSTLRNSLPKGEVSLIDVFSAPTAEAARAKLIQATGWDAQMAEALTGATGFNLPVTEYKNEIRLIALQQCVRLIKRLGASPEQLFDWAAENTDFAELQKIAQAIKRTVRAKYDDATWQTVAKPLTDKLRESQKTALIEYILSLKAIRVEANVSTADQLFEYFLIDVNMGTCMMTSRIKQGISSVQLFVDRCLMNLENKVASNAIDTDLWQWMKHYRIWEANRKVFLYPENWIEPELRDDKTPFFKELESELLQNDLTMDTAETAFLNYLEKLDEVARLEICGMYWEDKAGDFPVLGVGSSGSAVVELQELLNEAGASPRLDIREIFDEDVRRAVLVFQRLNNLMITGVVDSQTWIALDPSKVVNILHVFARTLHTSHVYYYRRLVNNSTWTPWEKVPVDIEGDHLIPVVWNRRLHIYWPKFTEKCVQPASSSETSSPEKYLEINLAWSEYKNNKWSGTQLLSSDNVLVAKEEGLVFTDPDGTPDVLDRALYDFKARTLEDGVLRIKCIHRAKSTSVGDAPQKFTWRIERPPVYDRDIPMPSYRFMPNDTVSIQAGGCVQTGGVGLTWKRYVNPSGPNSQTLYHGLIALPGMGLTRILDFINKGNKYTVPSSQDMTLHLGYEDDDYSDNGYWGHDNGTDGQCTIDNGGGPAWIEINITRQYSEDGNEKDGSAVGIFEFNACAGGAHVQRFTFTENLLVEPLDSAEDFMAFGEQPGAGSLWLDAGTYNSLSSDLIPKVSNETLIPTLGATPTAYHLLYPHQYAQYVLQAPFFYQDDRKTYFVIPTKDPVKHFVEPSLLRLDPILFRQVSFSLPSSQGALAGGFFKSQPVVSNGLEINWAERNTFSSAYWTTPVGSLFPAGPYHLKFDAYFHPYVCEFIKSLNKGGIPSLLAVDSERQHEKTAEFEGAYFPASSVQRPYPVEIVDLGPENKTPYSIYNWELFFHTVMLIATRLTQNQRFDEARHWFHYIFDPTDNGCPGLLAAYYNSEDLSGPPVMQFDSSIDFAWGGAPTPSISPDNFSVRWIGKLVAPFDGKYKFYITADDGIRLWINDEQMVDEWHPQVAEFSFEMGLQAAKPYDFRLDYFEHTGGATIKVEWESLPNQLTREVIPPSRFHTVLYWKFLPFMFSEKDRIWDLLELLSKPDNDLSDYGKEKKKAFQDQIKEWEQNPFQPHLIARSRIIAYQKNVVMKYLDNLIAWGDQLFRQDTIESINEATQLYILAGNILGPRPERIPPRGKAEAETYHSLSEKGLDEFSNALVMLENEFPFGTGLSVSGPGSQEQPGGILGLGSTLYFCTPKNDKLMGYWDTVADRLFKIRHCMNIEGVVRELPLFEPPIDPALLVRAAAAGVDLGSVLNDINTPIPHYRFTTMLQKAVELCAEVKALGAALLSAMEKKDAEALALLRSNHEIQVLNAMRFVKEKQVEEANDTLEGLNKYQQVVQARKDYYSSREFMNPSETAHFTIIAQSLPLIGSQIATEILAGALHLIPDAKLGFPTTVGATYGGSNIAGGLQGFAGGLGTTASLMNTTGSMAATLGGYQRRQDDWNNQADLAAKELDQVQKQIDAATIRVAIANQELQNHDLQIDNAKQIDDFMRNKFTNEELYSWMLSQVSGIYFQSYQLAYDIAKRVEKTYRFELGLTDSNFIQFGYWDSLKKGLLAGEKLYFDLKRMDMSYLDRNKREYEITRNLSLVLHDPYALIALKETGKCEISLPEMLFDADYPGHYMRRIKSVSLTVPCVVGPYTSINCTLTLLSNKTRITAMPAEPYPENLDEEDGRFVTNFVSLQSIATSNAQNDSGLFELNFRDERYLPFEGGG